MESAVSAKSQAKASQRGLSRQIEFSKCETKRLRIRKPHYDPRPISERLPVVDQVENLLEDLRAAHIELGEHKPSQVKQYGSSCLLKLLERTPPQSSPAACSLILIQSRQGLKTAWLKSVSKMFTTGVLEAVP